MDEIKSTHGKMEEKNLFPALSLLVLEEARVWVVASSSSEADFSSSDILLFSSGTPTIQKIASGEVSCGVGVVLLTVCVKS